MNLYSSLFVTILVASLSGCGDSGVDSPRGFSLPQGDIAKGEKVLLKHQCLSCHSVEGLQDDNIKRELQQPIKLGGESYKVTTYAELVTSIINPSHKISQGHLKNVQDENGKSRMRNYNDVMTVTELVNLVAYLQPKFKVKAPTYSPYGNYYIN